MSHTEAQDEGSGVAERFPWVLPKTEDTDQWLYNMLVPMLSESIRNVRLFQWAVAHRARGDLDRLLRLQSRLDALRGSKSRDRGLKQRLRWFFSGMKGRAFSRFGRAPSSRTARAVV